MLGRGVTRRHSPTVRYRREDQRRGEWRPSARRQPACRAEGDPPDRAYGASARETISRASSTIAARWLPSRKLSA